MSVERFLAEHSRATLSRAGRVLVVPTVDATVDQIEIVDFDVASSHVVGVLILLLGHDIGTNVVVGTVRVDSVLVQVVCAPVSRSLADWHLIFILLELVVVAAVDVA